VGTPALPGFGIDYEGVKFKIKNIKGKIGIVETGTAAVTDRTLHL
jgi:hypothetical protein